MLAGTNELKFSTLYPGYHRLCSISLDEISIARSILCYTAAKIPSRSHRGQRNPQVVCGLNIHDDWREKHSQLQMNTGPMDRNRIDYFFASKALCAEAKALKDSQLAGSEHLCPSVRVISTSTTKGRGHWQLRRWPLPQLQNLIGTMLDAFWKQLSPQQTRSLVPLIQKVELFCRQKQKAAKCQGLQSTERSLQVWRQANNWHGDNLIQEIMKATRTECEQWSHNQLWAAKQKKTKKFNLHFFEYERCSSFFLRRALTNRSDPPMEEARRLDNTIATDPAEIDYTRRAYWSEIFSANGEDSVHPLHPSNR